MRDLDITQEDEDSLTYEKRLEEAENRDRSFEEEFNINDEDNY